MTVTGGWIESVKFGLDGFCFIALRLFALYELLRKCFLILGATGLSWTFHWPVVRRVEESRKVLLLSTLSDLGRGEFRHLC